MLKQIEMLFETKSLGNNRLKYETKLQETGAYWKSKGQLILFKANCLKMLDFPVSLILFT